MPMPVWNPSSHASIIDTTVQFNQNIQDLKTHRFCAYQFCADFVRAHKQKKKKWNNKNIRKQKTNIGCDSIFSQFVCMVLSQVIAIVCTFLGSMQIFLGKFLRLFLFFSLAMLPLKLSLIWLYCSLSTHSTALAPFRALIFVR